MPATLIVVLVQAAVAPNSVEIRGHVVSGPRAVISIPALRIGTVAYESGAFKLHLRPRSDCYELLVTSVTRERTVYRFRPPLAGRLDLGDIRLPLRPPAMTWPDLPPLVADTTGACVPRGGPWPEVWTAGHARVHGTVSRGGRPLRRASVDVSCPYVGAFGRAATDSLGGFTTTLTVTFPADQALVDGGRTTCQLRHATESIDSPWPVEVRFALPDREAIDHNVAWALPEPDFRPSIVIAEPGDAMTPARLGNAVAFRPGVLGAPQQVRIGLVPRVAAPTLYLEHSCSLPPNADRAWGWEYCHMSLAQPDTLFRRYLLPLGLSVSTGRKQASTGSSVYLNLPGEYVDAIAAGGVLEAYSRVPIRYTSDSTAFVKHGLSYDPSLHLLSINFLSLGYDDERSDDHEYEAFFLFAVRPQAVGPSRPQPLPN